MVNTASLRDDRFSPELIQDSKVPTQRDSERILFSTGFRRLNAVTQVVGVDENSVFRNRLTHSLQVARVARDLASHLILDQRDVAEKLGGVDPGTTEAAALAHDLGHPPFGHIGEQELNDLTTQAGDLDGFEGNAQSFRIVTKIEAISEEFSGLNLTRATLNALLKYPRLREPNRAKWGAYSTEREVFEWARELTSGGDTRKSAEAEIMDWADDLTYAVHDVEDFCKAGLIPLHHLANSSQERETFFKDVFQRIQTSTSEQTQLEEAFTRVIAFLPLYEKYSGTTSQRIQLSYFTTLLYARYAGGIRLRVPSNRYDPRVEIAAELQSEVLMLKQLIWTYVIESPSLATQQYGQRKIVRRLFEIFQEAVLDKKLRAILPMAYREALRCVSDDKDKSESVRIVCDLVAGMTEKQANFLFRRLTGQTTGSAFDYVGY